VKPIAFLLAGGALSLLLGCGSDRNVGGGGFGGETISGRVVDSSGRPVPQAAVRARLARVLDRTSLRETTADDAGRFSLDGLPTASLRIEIAGRVGTQPLQSLLERDPDRPVQPFVARAAASRHVRIVDEAGQPVAATLQAYGLGAVASTDDAGMALLAGWPASDLWARVSPRDGGAAFDLFVPGTANGDLVASAGWPIDDFEGASTKTRLGILIGGGWWYAASSGTIVDPDGANVGQTVFGQGYDTTQAHGGRASLRVQFAFTPANPSRYGLVGFHWGVIDGAAVDLSGMDSLEIWLKGNGPVRIDLIAREQGLKRVYGKTATPGSGWTRFVLVPTDFVPIDGGTNWPGALAQTLYLQFSVFDDTEFWLDDLRLFARHLP
jgi:hypothetical protein